MTPLRLREYKTASSGSLSFWCATLVCTMKKRSFADKVRDIVRRIPEGEVMTYKQVATKAGSPNAGRAVGSIMKANRNPDIPCHRVIRSDGTVGGYNSGGGRVKRDKLKSEGVIVRR